MRYYQLLALFFIGTCCKAQLTVQSLTDSRINISNNSYVKDTNNDLDPFAGTWVLDNGTQYLKIVFKKKTMVNAGNYYEDLLIGEFQYKENGVELTNTLNKLINLPPNEYQHSIDGNYIMTHTTPFDDAKDNFRIGLTMSEPNGCSSNLDVRLATVNGQSAIEIFKRGGIITLRPGDPEPPEPFIPGGFYYLIKQ